MTHYKTLSSGRRIIVNIDSDVLGINYGGPYPLGEGEVEEAHTIASELCVQAGFPVPDWESRQKWAL